MKKFSHLTRTSLLLGFFFLFDKILAFARSIIIARQFSLSKELDAFNVANNLPDLLFALISGGALAMAFIPLLTEYLTKKGRAAAWDLFSRVANVAFSATAILAVLIAIFAGQIVRAQLGIAPGFGPEQQQLVVELMRLNLIGTVIFSVSGLVMAGLQANQHFLFPALAPTMYNLGMIIGALVFSPSLPYRFGPLSLPALGLGVHGLVYGVILGAGLHLAIQLPGLVLYHFRWTPSLDIRDSGLIEALKLIAPRLVTMFGIQLMFIARDNFASRLDQVGAVTSLTYGWMIMQVPETLLGTAIATALLPSLAEYAANQDWAKFSGTLEKAMRVMLALAIPAAAVMAAGLRPLLQVAFHFDEAGTNLLTLTSRIYLLTLAGYVLQETLARAFYARKQPFMPLFGVLVRLSIYLSIGVAAVTIFRAVGAPLIAAAELSLLVEAVLMLFWLNRRLETKVRVFSAAVKGLGAALLSGAAAYALAVYLPGPGYLTALAGMAVGGALALLLVRSEARLLFRL
ncbi:MAG TPA: lipid II flippase MurJ [Anaerolineales bacterium]|jgi:putative peptidoglycan lipid II flippase